MGSIVGQIGKIVGCRVVGIAGSDAKCAWLTDDLGFDAAINYKTENVVRTLHKHCPDGIDVIFENVGGDILDAELTWINNYARVAVCGLISGYNAAEKVPGPSAFPMVLIRRARVEGFIVMDYLDRTGEAIAKLSEWYAEGRLKYKVDVYDGLETAPRTSTACSTVPTTASSSSKSRTSPDFNILTNVIGESPWTSSTSPPTPRTSSAFSAT